MNVHTYELLYLENGTSDHRNEKTKTLYNTKYPPKPGKTHLRNHFWPLESGFSAIATYKTYVFSNAPNSRISKLGILNCFIHISPTAKTDLVANFVELGQVETCSAKLCEFIVYIYNHICVYTYIHCYLQLKYFVPT